MEQSNRSRLLLSESSYVRLRGESPNRILTQHYVVDETHQGQNIVGHTLDEFAQEYLGTGLSRKLISTEVIEDLSDLFILRRVT